MCDSFTLIGAFLGYYKDFVPLYYPQKGGKAIMTLWH